MDTEFNKLSVYSRMLFVYPATICVHAHHSKNACFAKAFKLNINLVELHLVVTMNYVTANLWIETVKNSKI